MTKKDYILIAEAIKLNADCFKSDGSYQATVRQVAETIARHLQRENTRFDASRFLVACGV